MGTVTVKPGFSFFSSGPNDEKAGAVADPHS